MCFKGEDPQNTSYPGTPGTYACDTCGPPVWGPKHKHTIKTLVMGAKVPLITPKNRVMRGHVPSGVPNWVPVPLEFCPTTQVGWTITEQNLRFLVTPLGSTPRGHVQL
jgi:hypothetical protein